MILASLDRQWRAALLIELDLDVPHHIVWAAMRDMNTFITIDPFHSRIIPIAPTSSSAPSSPAKDFYILHGFLGLGFKRAGKLLKWEENTGYTLSDLSLKNPHQAFPHIYGYRLTPISSTQCRLTVSVRGKWTLKWLGRWPVAFWLTGTAFLIELSLRYHTARHWAPTLKQPPCPSAHPKE